jgi:hypothetical protein
MQPARLPPPANISEYLDVKSSATPFLKIEGGIKQFPEHLAAISARNREFLLICDIRPKHFGTRSLAGPTRVYGTSASRRIDELMRPREANRTLRALTLSG